MAFLEWDERYSVGITSLDNHHKKIFALANQLYDAALIERKAKEIVFPIIEELIDYTQYHFHEEENLMESANYVELAAHRAEHNKFILKLNQIKEDAHSGKLVSVNIELSKTVFEWLANHTLKMDQAYKDSLKSLGQK